jgi:DNA (cytosine-5)-methyltransferase 1
VVSRNMVSLFSGAGGLDIGLERAGFVTLAATDFDADCAATLRHNRAARVPIGGCDGRVHLDESRIIHEDIAGVSAADLVEPGTSVVLVAGGPPCQPFSSAGRQLALSDPRGQLFHHFVRIVDELRPSFVLFENVRGLITARGPCGLPGEALDAVIRAFEAIGYATSCRLLNSADYGSAQRRVRFFMIASRLPSLPDFPEPTHAGTAGNGQGRWLTLGDFLSSTQEPADADVVRPRPELDALLRDLPDGSGLRSAGRREPTRPGGHWGYKQGTFIADQTKPARTVTAASTQDWIRLPNGSFRRLTAEECAGLQGFPRDWKFIGSRASQYRQVGNAVPIAFGECLGRSLAAAVDLPQDACSPSTKATSAPLPSSFVVAINYTKRDDDRNGHVRPRSPRFARTSCPA